MSLENCFTPRSIHTSPLQIHNITSNFIFNIMFFFSADFWNNFTGNILAEGTKEKKIFNTSSCSNTHKYIIVIFYKQTISLPGPKEIFEID